MKIRKVSILVLGLAAPLAQASIQVDSMSCSSNLTLDEQTGVSLVCSGDLALSGGSISAEDGGLLISALGIMRLNDISLQAFDIKLSAGDILMNRNVNLVAYNGNVEIAVLNEIDGGVDTRVLPVDKINGLTPGSGVEILPQLGANLNVGDIDVTNAYWPLIVSGSGVRNPTLSGGGLTLFAPRGEISTGEAGLMGPSIQAGSPVIFQGTPVVIPIPAAFSQFLLALLGFISVTLKSKSTSP